MSHNPEVRNPKLISCINHKRMEVEKLDISNIFEIQRIRSLLIGEPDLLSMFELLIVMSNNRLNKDADIIDTKKIIIEDNIEPDLLSESDSDDDFGVSPPYDKGELTINYSNSPLQTKRKLPIINEDIDSL